MARNFRRQRTAHPIADLNVTNLIDLGFMLLIIFMIATPLINQREQTTRINLPTVAQVPQQKADSNERFIVISLDASGRIFMENSSTPISMSELRTRLRGFAAEPKQPVIKLRGDGDVPYKKALEIVGEAQRVGLTRYALDSLGK